MYSQHNLTPYCTDVRQCLSVYSYLINFSFTPSVCIHSPIQHLTVQLSVSACRCTVILLISVSRHQSVFTAQSNILPYSCPLVPVGVQLSYQFQFHAVSLYSQPNPTHYRTAVRQCLSVYNYFINFSFTSSVSINSPIYHLTVHLSVSARRCTVIISISVSRRQSVFTAQTNTLPYSCPSVPVGLQLSYQFNFHAVSLYSQHKLTPYRTAVRQCTSVYSYLINFSFTPSVCIINTN